MCYVWSAQISVGFFCGDKQFIASTHFMLFYSVQSSSYVLLIYVCLCSVNMSVTENVRGVSYNYDIFMSRLFFECKLCFLRTFFLIN